MQPDDDWKAALRQHVNVVVPMADLLRRQLDNRKARRLLARAGIDPEQIDAVLGSFVGLARAHDALLAEIERVEGAAAAAQRSAAEAADLAAGKRLMLSDEPAGSILG